MNTLKKLLALILLLVALLIAGYTVFVHENRFVTILLLVSAALNLILALILWIQSKMKTRKERAERKEKILLEKEGKPEAKEETVFEQQTDVTDVQQAEATEKKKNCSKRMPRKKNNPKTAEAVFFYSKAKFGVRNK